MNQSGRQRAPVPPLDPHSVRVFKRLADEFSVRYADEFLYPHLQRLLECESEEIDVEEIAEKIVTARASLVVFFCHYAFARRGKDRETLANFAFEALGRLQGDKEFSAVLELDGGEQLWEHFEAICQENRRKPNEAQNRGLLQGMLELSQENYRESGSGSLTTWLVETVQKTRRIEPCFERIVDIRGGGPKSTSTFMRDIVYIFDLEQIVEPADRIYIHPIDRWLRTISRYIVPEPNMEKAADWIIAGKISKYSRRAGVSGIAFNMGTTFFGQKLVKEPARFEDMLKKLALGESVEESTELEPVPGDEEPVKS